MHFREIDRGEIVAVIGGLVLAVSLFLPWYMVGNRFADLNNCHGPNKACSGWDSLIYMRYILIVAAVSPLILLYVVIRRHGLSWPRGELTAVTALIALTFTLFRGLLDKPGTPLGQITLSFGWFVALAGGLLILSGALLRAAEISTRSSPPGAF